MVCNGTIVTMTRIGFIGCGNMGGAIASALCNNKEYSVSVYSAGTSAKTFASKHEGVLCAPSLDSLITQNDILVIALKPQVLPSIYNQIDFYGDEKCWISLAAGVSLDTLTRMIKSKNIVRVMPNLAAGAGASVTAIAASEKAKKDFTDQAFGIASLFGSAFFLEEKLFPAFIGTSASAMAYILQFIHALALGGCREGIAYEKAVRMACDTMDSAVKLVRSAGKSVVELETSVCSAGGTTVEGVRILEKSGFNGIVMDAVSAAAARAQEMENKA